MDSENNNKLDARFYKLAKFALLAAILVFGFMARSYNMDFPAIGYHNMKENDYLSVAEEMARTGDLITRRVYFVNALRDDISFRIFPQPALIPYQILISWKLFGENLWGPRLINILFGVASILVMYFIGRIFFRKFALSVSCAFLLTIMPLAIFFSRNLQPESQGFFFMLLAHLFYLRFATTLKKQDLFWGGVAASLAWAYKFSFILPSLLAVIFCFPYRIILKERKEILKYALVVAASFIIIPLAVFWLISVGEWHFENLNAIHLLWFFSPSYWREFGRMIWWYASGENFTPVFIATTLIGVTAAFVKNKSLIARYILGWLPTIIVYGMIFAIYINQHNYYQMPFLALVCIASVYALWIISEKIKVRLRQDYIFAAIFCMTVALSSPLLYGSFARMHATIFFGVDVAGGSLKEFTSPEERFFLFTHAQGCAIARYARRYAGRPSTLSEFQEGERKFNMRYACFYPAGYIWLLEREQPEFFSYIQEHYHIKEIGIIEDSNELNYIILERGAGADIKNSLQTLGGRLERRMVYRVVGRYIFFATLRPVTP